MNGVPHVAGGGLRGQGRGCLVQGRRMVGRRLRGTVRRLFDKGALH